MKTRTYLTALALGGLAIASAPASAQSQFNLFNAGPGSPYTARTPANVLLGDLNGDGKADLVDANTQSNGGLASQLDIFMGDGTGQFAEHLGCHLGPKRLAHMRPDETPEPFAQGPRLIRDLVQFARHGPRLDRVQRIGGNQLGLRQPIEKPLAVLDPVDRRINRRRNRVEKVEAKGIRNEDRGRMPVHRQNLSGGRCAIHTNT